MQDLISRSDRIVRPDDLVGVEMGKPMWIRSRDIVEPEIAVSKLLTKGAVLEKPSGRRGDECIKKFEAPTTMKTACELEILEKWKIGEAADTFENVFTHEEGSIAKADRRQA